MSPSRAHSPRRPITLLTSAPIVDVLPLSPPSSSSSSSTNFLSSSSHQLKLQLTPPTPTTPISSWPKSPSAFSRRSYSPSPSPSHDDQLRGTLATLPALVKTSLRSLLSSSLLALLSSTSGDDDEDYEEDEDGGILPSHSPKRELSRAHRSRGFRSTTRRSRGMGRSVKLVTMLVFWVCFVLWVTALMGVETIFE